MWKCGTGHRISRPGGSGGAELPAFGGVVAGPIADNRGAGKPPGGDRRVGRHGPMGQASAAGTKASDSGKARLPEAPASAGRDPDVLWGQSRQPIPVRHFQPRFEIPRVAFGIEQRHRPTPGYKPCPQRGKSREIAG